MTGARLGRAGPGQAWQVLISGCGQLELSAQCLPRREVAGGTCEL